MKENGIRMKDKKGSAVRVYTYMYVGVPAICVIYIHECVIPTLPVE